MMSGANFSRFLFQYQITPQTMTGLEPTEMLLGWKPKSHLDLLHPDVGEKVRVQQEMQKAWLMRENGVLGKVRLSLS